MSSRVAVAGVALIGAAIGLGAFASADSGDFVASLPTTPPVSVVQPGGGTGGGDGTGGGGGGGGGGEGGLDDGCPPWQRNDYLGSVDSADDVGRDALLRDGTFEAAIAASPDGTASLYTRICDGDNHFLWVPDGVPGAAPPPPTVDDLWPGAYDEAVSEIPLPIPEVAPPVIQGTLVNAPLWLAVTPPVPVSARAQVGAVWAQVDATFVGLTWDMGVPGTDDDVVECDGPGEVWDGLSPTEDQWQVPECGWNYEQPSTPEHTGTENMWYDISVTAHWDLRLTGSDGRDVALDPIDVPIEFDYVVYEWQTVGTG